MQRSGDDQLVRRLEELYQYCERHQLKAPRARELARFWHRSREAVVAAQRALAEVVQQGQREVVLQGRRAGRGWEDIAEDLGVSVYVLYCWRKRWGMEVQGRVYRDGDVRRIIAMWAFSDTSSRGIAECLGLPIGTVAGILKRRGMFPRVGARKKAEALGIPREDGLGGPPRRKRFPHYIYGALSSSAGAAAEAAHG